MNVSIVKTLTAGKRIGPESDSPRELVQVLISRPALDEDEFDLKGYIRSLEAVLNNEETSDEEYSWVMDRITFLGGTVEWDVDPWNEDRERLYVHL